MAITGPIEVSDGWVFTLRRDYMECDDAPVAVYTWIGRTEEALNWAKTRFEKLFYPPATDTEFYLGFPELEDATYFKLMWMG